MKCRFCKNEFSSKTSLNHHQKTAKYCLKLQGKYTEFKLKCPGCDKSFTRKYELNRHIITCKKSYSQINNEHEQTIKHQKILINQYLSTIKDLQLQISVLQDKLENVAIKAVQKPTSINNTKNIQINNFLKSAPPLTDQVLKDNVENLTLDHHVQGAEGYAKYALEFPFKGRIVCVDVSRDKIKYKDGEGNVVDDVGFRKMMMKLCKELYQKSYILSIDHLDKLSKQFTEKELEQYDYLEAAKAIALYSKGSDSNFCRKIIKIISRSVNESNT
jgi:hypothetical protein